MKSLYLYIGNHSSVASIATFIKWIKKDFNNVKEVKKIKSGEINFLIENFKSSDVKNIIDEKNINKTKFILLTTEIFNEKSNTFNSFRHYNFFSFFYINLNYIFIELLRKLNFKKKIKLNKKKINELNLNNNKLNKFFYESLELHSLKRRYKNFKFIENYIDIFLYTHPEIKKYLPSNKAKFIYPYSIKNEKSNKKSIFGFSGKLTAYRKKKFQELSKKNFPNQFKNFLKGLNYSKNFYDDYKKNKSSRFKLHLRRDKYWNFISPVRIINSLRRNEIPIICDNFKSNYMKSMCLELKQINFKTIKQAIESEKKIKRRLRKNIKIFNNSTKKNLIQINNRIKSL